MQERWWESFYDDAFADVVMATGDDAAAQSAAEFLIRKLELQPGDRVFDQCCGIGRVSVPIAQRGIEVVGVDIIEAYIRRARAAAETRKLNCRFHVGDGFQFVPDAPCDGAFNWWSSFGYVEEDERNVEMLRRAWEALKPGGRFAMDYYSVPRLLREFQAQVRLTYRTTFGEFQVTRSAHIDFAAGMIRQLWQYEAPDGSAHRKQSMTKMLMPHQLRELLHRAGFAEVELFGNADGSPFTLESPRCMLLARKPE